MRSLEKYQTNKVPTAVMRPSRATEALRSKPSPSSRKAIPGCNMERELVTAAMNSSTKKIAAKR